MKSLRRLLPFMRPYAGSLLFGLALVVVAAALQSVLPWLLRRAVDDLGSGAPVSRAWWIGGEMIAVALVGGALRFGMRQVLNGVSRWVEYDLRNALFAHLTTLDADFYARWRTGDVMARLTNDLGAVRMAAGPAIMYLVNTVAGGIFALVFMLRISGRLTLFALLPMIGLPFVMARLGRLIHTRFEAVQEYFGTMTTLAQENLAGTRVVRAYRQEAAEEARFAAMNEEYLARNMSLVRLYGAMNPAFALIAGIGAVTVLGLGGTMAVRGTITIGDFVAFGFYLGILTWPLIALGWVINLFQRGAASMSRLNELLDARAAVTDPAAPRALPPAAAGRTLEFRDVGFHYPTEAGAEPRWVLRHVSFTVPAGGTLGVVGATGSGKSALLDLIPRLHDPQEGQVLVDGVPVTELSLRELRAEVGFAPQESLLFSDTIGENLRYGTYGDEVATPSPTDALTTAGLGTTDAAPATEIAAAAADAGDDGADVRWAAEIAQLDESVRGFPNGYSTVLGERGINLSGGQKQRAALARALARRPSVVLLDDALSAVDTHTEARILAGLRGVLRGRTAVIASHRASAIREATTIVVLDGGRVVEQGVHETLMAQGGRYWSLLRRQQLEESIEDDAGAQPVAAGAVSSAS